MSSVLLAAFLVLGQAQQPSVTLDLKDGTVIQGFITTEVLQVKTYYGDLSIPMGQVQSVEFGGGHLSKEMDAEVKQAIRQLGSKTHKDREAATTLLASRGAMAYLLILEAAESKDLEVAVRARKIAEQIKRSGARLPESDQDKIVAEHFTLTGVIQNESLKVATNFLGSQEIPIHTCKYMRVFLPGTVKINLQADYFGTSNDPSKWYSTGVRVVSGVPIKVSTTGRVDLYPTTPGQYECGPDGHEDPNNNGNSGKRAGSLWARIGNGDPFLLGTSSGFTPNSLGELQLHIVPPIWRNPASGAYVVEITTGAK